MKIPVCEEKAARAKHVLECKFDNTEKFSEAIAWLNKNVGRGKENWCMSGKPGRFVRNGRVAHAVLYVFNEEISELDLVIFGIQFS